MTPSSAATSTGSGHAARPGFPSATRPRLPWLVQVRCVARAHRVRCHPDGAETLEGDVLSSLERRAPRTEDISFASRWGKRAPNQTQTHARSQHGGVGEGERGVLGAMQPHPCPRCRVLLWWRSAE